MQTEKVLWCTGGACVCNVGKWAERQQSDLCSKVVLSSVRFHQTVEPRGWSMSLRITTYFSSWYCFGFFFVYWCLENSHTHSPRSGPVSLAGFVTKPILPCRVSWKQYAVMWGTVNTSTLCVTVCINTCTTHSHTPLGKTDAAFKCGWKHNYEFSAHE